MARRKKKEPRRKPGTGTVRHRAGRALPWEASIQITGKTLYDSFDTREKALAWLDGLVGDITTGRRNVIEGATLVQDFLPTWLASKANIKPTTRESYTYYLGFAVAYFHGWRIDEVQRPDAERFLSEFAKKHKNASQLRAVCRQAFQYAADEEYIRKNPFQNADAPAAERREGVALTKEQRARLLSAARGHPLEILWHLHSRLGLRRGEGAWLRWGDVDLEKGTVTIKHQKVDVRGIATESTPKTKRSRRPLPLPDDLVSLLSEHKKTQRKRAAADKDWREHGLIFTAEHGEPLTIWNVRHAWEQFRDAAGFPGLRLHDLRHTALTILALDGVPENILEALAGHDSAEMRKHYTDHATVEDIRRALG